MLTIHPADPYQVAVALNVTIDWPAVAFIGIDDGALAGSGGLAWGSERCWLWFQTSLQKPEYARPVLKMAHKLLRKAEQLGETQVFTVRDKQFETSPRLLKLTGFKFYAAEHDQDIYRCEIGRATDVRV
jgi:hypothetical protein